MYGSPPSPPSSAVPLMRIMSRLDQCMARRDYASAERHLLYWLQEAQQVHDNQGQTAILGEMIGFYRKTAKADKVLQTADRLLLLLKETGLEETLTGATALVNTATALGALKEYDRALALFEKARSVYEKCASVPPSVLGGFYNNMGLTLTALKRYEEARESYRSAVEQIRKAPFRGAPEEAVSCLNLADTAYAQYGDTAEVEIDRLLSRAFRLLDEPGLPRDGNYAFVCEKCASVFDHYGYFREARILKERSEAIYERIGKGT